MNFREYAVASVDETKQTQKVVANFWDAAAEVLKLLPSKENKQMKSALKDIDAIFSMTDLREGVDYQEALQNGIGSSDKYDQALWDWFMDNMGDSNIYAGDAVPEDYIEIMDKKQAKECYTFMSKKFKKYMNESNINNKNWQKLKAFMKKQPGFDSWTFEGDYETLVIKFKNNKQASNAIKKSNDSFLEVSAFGDASSENSEIRVELNNDAIKALEN
jgi:predicted DNA binding CopG/RHH family protein